MTPETAPNGPKKILIAEDDTSLMEIMTMQLGRKGFTVRGASNGKKATEMLQEELPDVMLLDLLMPEMDGFEVLKFMKDNNIHVPTIVLTNLGQEDNCEKSLELGATDCLVKSDTPLNKLEDKINEISGQTNVESAGA